ncbi:hypothetical protein T03_14979 [Trichinella britovi]|uniref:Uncharacterized protein n=1 Tax=Trichinella britovi TaxID=45882 RepID=A0A0V1CP25_TRIBR|nr:hypothetical protein T03_14979 [Trichinella britovi]
MAQEKAIKAHADSRQYYKYHSFLSEIAEAVLQTVMIGQFLCDHRPYKNELTERIFSFAPVRCEWGGCPADDRKLKRAVCTDGDIVFNTVRRHVIVFDTEGGCDCLSDATRLVCSLFLNVRPRSTLSTVFYISYQPNLSLIVIPIGYLRIGRRISGRFVDGFHSPARRIVYICLSHFIHHALHPFSKSKMESTCDCSNLTY